MNVGTLTTGLFTTDMGFDSAFHAPSTPATGGAIAGTAGTVVDPITEQAVKAKSNAQIRKSSSPWGNAIPLSMGARAVTGKVIWSSDFREIAQSEDPSSTTQTPHYVVDVAVSFGFTGTAPEKRAGSQLVRMWAQQIMCYDVDDSLITEQFNGMKVRFHPGLIDALPDVLIQADKGDFTPAWRNQMYVVIENLPLWLVGQTDNLPDFVAEIYDTTTGAPEFLDYTLTFGPIVHGGGGITGFSRASPFLYDSLRSAGYAFIHQNGGTSASIGTYNLLGDYAAGFTEVARADVPGQGDVDMGAAYGGLQNNDLCVHDVDHQYALTVDTTSNSSPLHLVNLPYAQITSTLGKFSTSLSDVLNADPAQTQVTYKVSGDCFKTQYFGTKWYGFILGGIFDQVAIVTYREDGTGMKLSAKYELGGDVGLNRPENIRCITTYPILDRPDLALNATAPTAPVIAPPAPPVTGTATTPPVTPTAAPSAQQAFAFVAHGPRVTLMRILSIAFVADPTITRLDHHLTQEIVDVLTFPGGTVQSIYVDPNDYNLVIFWTPNDKSDGTIYMAKVAIVVRDSLDPTMGKRPYVGAMLYNVKLPEPYPAYELRFAVRERIPSATFGYQSSNDHFIEIDLASGAVLHTTAIAREANNGYIYDGRRGTFEYLNHDDDKIEHIKLRNTGAEKMLLADVISAFMLNAGYTADQFIVDGSINDTCYGAMVDQNADLWSTMGNIGIVYDFQYFISGDKVKFTRPPLTSDGPSFAVDLSNLYGAGSNPFDAFTTVFASPDELPGNTGITYIDKDQRYVANTQTFRRTNFPVVVAESANDTTVPVPIIMQAAEALRRSGQATFAQYAKNEVYTFKLPFAYLRTEPVDVVQVTTHEFTYNVLIGEVVFDTDWTLGITGSNRSVRTSNAFRVGPDGNWIDPGTAPFTVDPTLPPVRPVGTSPSDPVLIDIPFLSIDESLSNSFLSLFAGASSRVKSGWVGANVSTQVDFHPWQTFFHAIKSVPLGRAIEALPLTVLPFQTDTETVITVDPANFDPSIVTSISSEDFLAGNNALVVGTNGRWEVIYFRDVELDGTLLKLSTLTRGCRGTEVNCNNHTAGDLIYFVTLDGSRQGLLAQSISYLEIGLPFRVRARGDHMIGDVPTAQANIDGNSLKPFAPWAEKGVLGADINLVAAPSYLNTCGGGPDGTRSGIDRRSNITVTFNHLPNPGRPLATFDRLVNGNEGTDDANSGDWATGLTDGVLLFDFRPSGFKQHITEMQFFWQNGNSQGAWDIEASDDGVSWTSLSSSVDISAGGFATASFANVDGFWLYRLRQVSGSTTDVSFREAYFKTEATLDANDLAITWQRRDRLGEEFVENVQPMSETAETYDLEILKDSAIVRTLTGLTSPVYVYSEADQTTDGFTPPIAEIEVRIYQNGTNIARGFAREATIEVGA